MKSSFGHIATRKIDNETGLILGESKINNEDLKADFSLDSSIEIERISLHELRIGEVKNHKEVLVRLLRDIKSASEQTRIWASQILCDFVEEVGSELELNVIETSINIVIERISIEDNWDVGQKLGEVVYEFFCLQKIDKKSELSLVTKLALLNKDFLYSYLDDEQYLQIKEVNDFINDKTKWWNTSS